MANTLPIESLAYAAGLFDGEGFVSIIPYHRTGKYRNKDKTYYRLEVAISNSYFPVMLWFKSNFGGYLYTYSQGVRKNGGRCYLMARWGVKSRNAIKFLELILPFLQQKKREAEIAIAFYHYKEVGNTKRTRNAEVIRKQAEMCQVIRLVRTQNIIQGQAVLKEESNHG